MRVLVLFLFLSNPIYAQEIDQYDDVAKFEWSKTSENMTKRFDSYLDEYDLSEEEQELILELDSSALKRLSKELFEKHAVELENGNDQLESLFSESYNAPINRAGGYVCSKSDYIRLVEASYWWLHSNDNVKLDVLVVDFDYLPFIALLETKYDCHAFM